MCRIECWTTSKCVQLAKSCPWAAKTDLTCYIKLDLNVGRQALALRSASGPKNKMQRQNTKCGIKIQMLWSMDIVFLPETSQTTAHHCVFYDLTFYDCLHMMRWLECSVLRLSRIILGTRSSSHLVSTFILALPFTMCRGHICEPGKKLYFTTSQQLFITICPWGAKHFSCIFWSIKINDWSSFEKHLTSFLYIMKMIS